LAPAGGSSGGGNISHTPHNNMLTLIQNALIPLKLLPTTAAPNLIRILEQASKISAVFCLLVLFLDLLFLQWSPMACLTFQVNAVCTII
jgi:hypothetical protein